MKEVQKAEEKLRKADALHYFENNINQMKQMCEENQVRVCVMLGVVQGCYDVKVL